MTYAPFTTTKRVQLTSVGLKKKKNEKTKTVKEYYKNKKGTEKRAAKNVQLVMQHCYKMS